MADSLLRRRALLQRGAHATLAAAGLGLLGGCRREDPQLLASRGDLPQGWSRTLPSPWQVRVVDDPATVIAAAEGVPAPSADRRAALLQLGDGWATRLNPEDLQPIGTEALLGRLAPMAGPVSRLFRGAEAPALAFPWSVSPWVLVLRGRSDLAARHSEGWSLLLDPSLKGKVVLPSGPRLPIALMEGDRERLRRLRSQALAYDDRDGLNLLLSGDAEAAVMPRSRVVPLLRRDPRIRALLPASGAPLSWNLLLRPAGPHPEPPLTWLAEVLEPPLLPRLLAAGWVPPLPRSELEKALLGFPVPLRELLLPPEQVLSRCRSLPPLAADERQTLQRLWDSTEPAAGDG